MDKISKTIIAAFAALIVIVGLLLTIKPAKPAQSTAFKDIEQFTATVIRRDLLKQRNESFPTTNAEQLEILRVDIWNYAPFSSTKPADYHWVFVIQKGSFKRTGDKIFYKDSHGDAQLINTNGMKDLEVSVTPVLETDDTTKYLGIHALG